ncbi:tyrosine--tRNA ligase, partial [bacterium]|nr:tyrosine--tRNA ligase [bacterium]
RMQKTHLSRTEIRDVTLRGLLFTLRHITHGRLIARSMFQERLKNGGELFMHEMVYPVLQGIDSYMMHLIYGSCDMEVGGNDQTFNMLMGRDVMRANGISEQAVLSFKLLEGLDGKQKMSKSLDNYVAIIDAPALMYGKVMSIPDASMPTWFELCTYTPMKDVKRILRGMDRKDGESENPRDIKMRLAREIVSIYHGEEKAKRAEEEYVSVFQKGELPADMPIVSIAVDRKLEAQEILEIFFFGQGEQKSRSDIKRLIEQGALTYQGKKITDPHTPISPAQGDIVKVGKKQWFKVGVAGK